MMRPRRAAGKSCAQGARCRRPVFIVGCPRSGTTLLYHMLLSAGGFVVYRTEARTYDLLGPRFGWLRTRSQREQLLDVWLDSFHYERSGLDRAEIRERVLEECGSAGDFLGLIMDAMAERQGVSRWAECTPMHALYVDKIRSEFPDALFIHIVRDGRDVALSLRRTGWIQPLPWDRTGTLVAPALYWRWLTGVTAESTEGLDRDSALDVRYEDLVRETRATLERIGTFLEHELDYDRIQRVAIGSVAQPDSSFHDEEFTPVERWKTKLTPDEQERLDSLLADRLPTFGYDCRRGPAGIPAKDRALRFSYDSIFRFKHWLKASTPAGRFLVNLQDITEPPRPAVRRSPEGSTS